MEEDGMVKGWKTTVRRIRATTNAAPIDQAVSRISRHGLGDSLIRLEAMGSAEAEGGLTTPISKLVPWVQDQAHFCPDGCAMRTDNPLALAAVGAMPGIHPS